LQTSYQRILITLLGGSVVVRRTGEMAFPPMFAYSMKIVLKLNDHIICL